MPKGNEVSAPVLSPKEQYVEALFDAGKVYRTEKYQNAFWKAYRLGVQADPKLTILVAHKAAAALWARNNAWPNWEKI